MEIKKVLKIVAIWGQKHIALLFDRSCCCKDVPLDADKMGNCKLKVHFIKTYYKKEILSSNDCYTSIVGGSTLGSDHHGHLPWHQGVEVEEVGWCEGTPVDLVIQGHSSQLHDYKSIYLSLWSSYISI